jgi:hypothetical protein
VSRPGHPTASPSVHLLEQAFCHIGIKLIDWRIIQCVPTEGNRLRRTRSDVFPIIGVVVSAVLIVIGRTQRNNPVAIAGYIVLVLSVVLYLYLRSRRAT